MSYRVVLNWGSKERGREILNWIDSHCQSFEGLYSRPVNPSKPFIFENVNMELWFGDEQDALLCDLKWNFN